MKQVEVVLKNKTGLHARPASRFVQQASEFISQINLVREGKEYNAKSIVSILSMEAGKGTRFVIRAEGEDESRAAEALKALVESGFGE